MSTQAEILDVVVAALPPPTIRNFNLKIPGEIRFEWFNDTYRVDVHLRVEQVEGGLLSSGPKAALMAQLLRVKAAEKA